MSFHFHSIQIFHFIMKFNFRNFIPFKKFRIESPFQKFPCYFIKKWNGILEMEWDGILEMEFKHFFLKNQILKPQKSVPHFHFRNTLSIPLRNGNRMEF